MPRSFGLLRSVGVRRGHEAAALMKRRKPGMSIPMQRDGRLGFCDRRFKSEVQQGSIDGMAE